MKVTIRRTWIRNQEPALYDISIDDTNLKIVETCGAPIALDGAFDFSDDCVAKLDGIDFVDEHDFSKCVAQITNMDDHVTETVDLDAIASDGIRSYIRAAIMTLRHHTWSEFNALPFDLRDGVEQFYEPGYEYDDPDFWACYEPEPSKDFIDAVQMYDWLMRQ